MPVDKIRTFSPIEISVEMREAMAIFRPDPSREVKS
jgi:hypothetical protein